MRFGDIVDELLDEHRLAHTRAAEQADLSAFRIGCQQIDDFNAGDENLGFGGLAFEIGRLLMDRASFH